jgi:hypothetical protein
MLEEMESQTSFVGLNEKGVQDISGTTSFVEGFDANLDDESYARLDFK